MSLSNSSMSWLPAWLRSLLLTALVSFTLPVLLLGGALSLFFAIAYLPGLGQFGTGGAAQVFYVLATFGSGCAPQGAIAIGLTCGLVGGLFSLFNAYRYLDLGQSYSLLNSPAPRGAGFRQLPGDREGNQG